MVTYSYYLSFIFLLIKFNIRTLLIHSQNASVISFHLFNQIKHTSFFYYNFEDIFLIIRQHMKKVIASALGGAIPLLWQ